MKLDLRRTATFFAARTMDASARPERVGTTASSPRPRAAAAIWDKLDYIGAAALASVFVVLACVGYALCVVTGNLPARL